MVRAFSSPAAHTCYTPPHFQTRRVTPFLSNGRIQREADKGAGRATGATPAKVVLEADALGRSLALRMTIENVSKLDMTGSGSELIRRLETSSAPSPFAAYLQDVEVMAMLKAAPLTTRSGELSFVHKTVQEYLAASGLVASLHRAFDGTSLTDVESLLDEQAKASKRTNEATKSIVTSEPAVGVAEVAANAARLLKSAKARPLERLLAGLPASPLSQLRLAREEDGSVIEEQVLDFLVDAVLSDTGLAAQLRVLRKLVGAVELHGGVLEQVGRNLQTLLTARLAKRAHGTLLHEAAREGNVAVLCLALDACKDMAAESESNASKGVAGDAAMKVAAVDAPDDHGQTALYVAAVAGNEEAVMLLLKNDANAGARAHLVAELALVKNKVGSQGSERGARVRGLVAKGCVPQFEDDGGSKRFVRENLAVGAWMAGLTSAAVEDGCWRFEVEVVEVPIEQGVEVGWDGWFTCPPELSVGWSADDAVVDAFIPPGVEGDLIAIATCNEDVYGKKMEAVRGVALGRDTSSIGFESRGTVYCNIPFEIFDNHSCSVMEVCGQRAGLQKWSKGDKLGVAIDMTRHVAFFAINDGEWVEVPLPKEEKRFFPALSGRFSGGELRLSIGERGDDGWRKLKPPPGTGPFRAIKDAATGNTPALAAAASGHITVARVLLERDASVWTDVEREHRWTLLHASARWNDKVLMEEALKHAPGSESMRDAEGLFPVELAALHQQKDVLAVLLERDVVKDSFATLKDLLTVFPKVLDLSERKPPLGPRNAELLSGLLLVHGEGCHQLNLCGQNPQTSGSKALAKVLKVNGGLTSLDLSNNSLCGVNVYGGTYTAEGITAIADALRVNGGLTSIDVRENNIAGDGAVQLAAAVLGNLKIEIFNKIPIKEMRANSLTELDLKEKYVGVEGGMVVAGLIPVMGALTALDLSFNDLKDESASAVCEAIKSNKETKLASLNVKKNGIGSIGANAVATMVAVTGGLTSINLSGNHLTKYGTDMTGIKELAAALVVNGALTRVDVRSNNIAGDSAEQLSAAILGNLKIEMFNEIPIKEIRANSITELDLQWKGIGVEGVMVLAVLIPVMGGLTSIDLSGNTLCGLGWQDGKGIYTTEGITAIADALRVNGALTKIDVSWNRFGPEGAKVFADALRVNGGLTALNASHNYLKDEGVSAICKAIQSNKETKLDSLNFKNNSISPVGANAVAAMVAVTGGLTSLNLSENQLCGLDWYGVGTYTAEGITAIADAMHVNGGLTSLDLSSNQLCGLGLDGRGTYTAEGITAIADALRVNGGLTGIDLSGNKLCGIWTDDEQGDQQGTYTAEGVSAIADALRVNGGLTKIRYVLPWMLTTLLFAFLSLHILPSDAHHYSLPPDEDAPLPSAQPLQK